MRLWLPFALLISAYGADFTTYIGGPSQNPDQSTAGALATDLAGDTYVTGVNGFVTKLDPAGNIAFTATLGPGNSYTYGHAIAVDPSGNVWIGGQTLATDFPLVNALQSSPNASGSGFLVKMAPDGTVLYSSYFGGTLGDSAVYGIATDANGNVYVTGFTDASDFPATAGLPASPVTAISSAPVYGAFAAKLDSAGQKILYSTVIAGPQACAFCFPVPTTQGNGIAVDGAGNALVAGSTNTTDLPVPSSAPALGAFVFRINAAGNALVYFTYLGSGGLAGNSGTSTITLGTRPIALDASGNAYVAGYTNSIVGANPQTIAMVLTPAGVFEFGVLLGSPAGSRPNAIALDASGNAWLTGTNGSASAPGEPFVEQLTSTGAILPYLADFPPGAAGQDIAIDASGVVHFAGPIGLVSTITEGQPLAPRALGIVSAASGELSGTVAPGEIISIYGLGLGPTNPVTATPENGLFPTSLGGIQVLLNGVPIPLLYVSATQIDAEIPSPLQGAATGIALVRVMNNSALLPDFRLAVISSDFAVFEKSGGSMAVMNQDGTVNKIGNPAQPGSIVSIWATGFGATGPPADGAVAASANNYCGSCQVTLNFGPNNVFEAVQYAGSSPGLIDGVMQINFMIPAQFPYNGAWVYFAPPGDQPLLRLGWVDISQ